MFLVDHKFKFVFKIAKFDVAMPITEMHSCFCNIIGFVSLFANQELQPTLSHIHLKKYLSSS